MKPKKVKVVFGPAVLRGAGLARAITGIEESKAYHQTVPELKAMGVKAKGRRIRVAGNVVAGSIERPSAGVVKFEVDYEGEKPRGSIRRSRASARYSGRPCPGGGRGQAFARWHLRSDGRPSEMRFEV